MFLFGQLSFEFDNASRIIFWSELQDTPAIPKKTDFMGTSIGNPELESEEAKINHSV